MDTTASASWACAPAPQRHTPNALTVDESKKAIGCRRIDSKAARRMRRTIRSVMTEKETCRQTGVDVGVMRRRGELGGRAGGANARLAEAGS